MKETTAPRWFGFTTRDLVVMGILIAVTGAFQAAWSQLVFTTKVLGPWTQAFASFGFNIAAFIALYFVPVPGAATIVKTFGAVVEVLLGNPFGPPAIYYGFAEGIAIDLAFVLFRRKMTLGMTIAGSLLAWIIAAPMDIYIDKVALNYEALVAYFSPGGAGKVWIGFLCWLTLVAMVKAKVRSPRPVIVSDQQPTPTTS
jgi:ABC-type thiamin/hydroxymethylpyrimidine transport system permease subunit